MLDALREYDAATALINGKRFLAWSAHNGYVLDVEEGDGGGCQSRELTKRELLSRLKKYLAEPPQAAKESR